MEEVGEITNAYNVLSFFLFSSRNEILIFIWGGLHESSLEKNVTSCKGKMMKFSLGMEVTAYPPSPLWGVTLRAYNRLIKMV